MIGCFEGLVEWDDWDEGEPDLGQVSGATFLKDFGPFKKGQKVDVLAINAGDGVIMIHSYDKDGKEQETVQVELVCK